MLPSFRLIAATFLCGFIVVFAGLRIAASLNDIHEALPVMAAHAPAVAAETSSGPELGRGPTAPAMYNTPFIDSTGSFGVTMVRLTSPPERIAAVLPAMLVAPSPVETPPPASAATPTSRPDTSLAALQIHATVDMPRSGPMPTAAAPIEPPKPEALKPEMPIIAAVERKPEPAAASAPVPTFDIPMIEPAEVDLSELAAESRADVARQNKAAAVEPTLAPEPSKAPTPDDPPDAVDLGAPSAIMVAPPLPKAKPALRVRARSKARSTRAAAAKPVVRKPIRTARRAVSNDPFGGSFGQNSNSNFKYEPFAFGGAK
jgi:hypothetical protein